MIISIYTDQDDVPFLTSKETITRTYVPAGNLHLFLFFYVFFLTFPPIPLSFSGQNAY
jgi:hypothetical protein